MKVTCSSFCINAALSAWLPDFFSPFSHEYPFFGGIFQRFLFRGSANNNQKVLFDEGISSTIGEHAKELGTHAFLVSDPGIREAGHVDRIKNLIQDAGVQVTVFDQSIENPTESSVALCASIAKEAQVDLIVGLGGGSSMDTAKGCNFLLTNGGKMEDYWGVGKKLNSQCFH